MKKTALIILRFYFFNLHESKNVVKRILSIMTLFCLRLIYSKKELSNFINSFNYQNNNKVYKTSSRRIFSYVDDVRWKEDRNLITLEISAWIIDFKERISSLVFYINNNAFIADLHLPSPNVEIAFPYIKYSNEADFFVNISFSKNFVFETNNEISAKIILANGEIVFAKFDIDFPKLVKEDLFSYKDISPEYNLKNFITSDNKVNIPFSSEAEIIVCLRNTGDLNALYKSLTSLSIQVQASFQTHIFSMPNCNCNNFIEEKFTGIINHIVPSIKDIPSVLKNHLDKKILYLDNCAELSSTFYIKDLIRFYKIADNEDLIICGKVLGKDDYIEEAGGIISNIGEYRSFGKGLKSDDSSINYTQLGIFPGVLIFSCSMKIFSEIQNLDVFESDLYTKLNLFQSMINKGVKTIYKPEFEGFISSEHPCFFNQVQSSDISKFMEIHGDSFKDNYLSDKKFDLYARNRLYSKETSSLVIFTYEECLNIQERVSFIIDNFTKDILQNLTVVFISPPNIKASDLYTCFNIPEFVEVKIIYNHRELITFINDRNAYYSLLLIFGLNSIRFYLDISFHLHDTIEMYQIWFEPILRVKDKDLFDYLDSEILVKEYLYQVDGLVLPSNDILKLYENVDCEKLIIS